MDKLIVDVNGSVDEYVGADKRKHTRFPVYLTAKCSKGGAEVYHDFILNTSRRGLFIKTDSPLPRGTSLTIHIYIPPDSKLLGEFKGYVVAINRDNPSYPKGMHIKLAWHQKKALQKLEAYLEERQHLVDSRA